MAVDLYPESVFKSIQEVHFRVPVTSEIGSILPVADVLQGLTRARFANPPRFSFKGELEKPETRWSKAGVVLTVGLRDVPDSEGVEKLGDDDLFEVDIKSDM